MLIRQHIKKYTAACDLNHIDVSRITSMNNLFADSPFNGDISKWDVSRVTNMEKMFYLSVFKGNISDWNVACVKNMDSMFSGSSFQNDVSRWNTSHVTSMDSMFQASKFNGDISLWNVGACTNFSAMFTASAFNQPLSQWDMQSAQKVNHMFHNSLFANDVSAWHLPLSCNMWCLFDKCNNTMALQSSADWHAKLYLDNGSLPSSGLLLEAFLELNSIHDALGCSNEERARDLVQAVVAKRKGKVAGPLEGESWALPELM